MKKHGFLIVVAGLSALATSTGCWSNLPYTIINNTNETFSNVTIADPTVRQTQSIINPGTNTIQLKEDIKVVIRLETIGNDVLSIIMQPGQAPTCYPRPSRCQFETDQADRVTLLY